MPSLFSHPHSDWKWKRPTSEQGNSGFTHATTQNEYRVQTGRQNSPAKLRIPPTLPTKLLRNTYSNSLAQALPCPELNQPERAMPMTTTYSIDTLTAPKTKQPSTFHTSETLCPWTLFSQVRQNASDAHKPIKLRFYEHLGQRKDCQKLPRLRWQRPLVNCKSNAFIIVSIA